MIKVKTWVKTRSFSWGFFTIKNTHLFEEHGELNRTNPWFLPLCGWGCEPNPGRSPVHQQPGPPGFRSEGQLDRTPLPRADSGDVKKPWLPPPKNRLPQFPRREWGHFPPFPVDGVGLLKGGPKKAFVWEDCPPRVRFSRNRKVPREETLHAEFAPLSTKKFPPLADATRVHAGPPFKTERPARNIPWLLRRGVGGSPPYRPKRNRFLSVFSWLLPVLRKRRFPADPPWPDW